MGVEAVAAGAALIGAGTGALGLRESVQANKRARREAADEKEAADEAKELAKAEKARLTEIEKDARKKLAKGHRRIRGGLFGEEPEQKSTLG